MNLARQIAPRRLPLLFLSALLLASLVLALAGATHADARVRVVAEVSPATPGAVRVTARTSTAAERVLFFVDGDRQNLSRSVDWRHGRKGVLKGLPPGRHRLAAVAFLADGKTAHGSRVIHLSRKTSSRNGGSGDRSERRAGERRPMVALKPARPVAEQRASDGSRALPPGVLFDGGFDDGFDSWHLQALSHRAATFGDGAFHGNAAHFEVHQGDVEPETGSQRAEVSGPTFDEGQELYVRDTIRVPSSSSFEASWQLIQQLREEDWGGSPGMAVFLEDDHQLKIGAGDSSPMYWEGPELQSDRWYDLVYRVKLSQDSNAGFVEVWLDGVPQEMLNGETRIYGQTIQRAENYIKTGIYRSSSSTGTSVVEHDNVIVGTSYEAVMAAG